MATAMDDVANNLKRGWTTGACATAATRAAYTALITGTFPDPVRIVLPKGDTPEFPLALEEKGENWAKTGIVKDAGDDPDVTHGALVIVKVTERHDISGVHFKAGEGIGTITKPGLPLPPGEPAINPVPRRLMTETISEIAAEFGVPGDVEIEISVPGGLQLAEKTWNPRLGILNGISILGTTGVVHPFSCSAWIHSIHRGIDVARAEGLDHVAGATGSTSEAAVQVYYDLPLQALIDMGDFAGGMLKYLRKHPVPRVTIAGGFGKITKLGQGMLDLHSGRSQVDFDWLARRIEEIGGSEALQKRSLKANTAAEVLALSGQEGLKLGDAVAGAALETAEKTVRDAPIKIDILIVDRQGEVVGRAP